MRFDDRVGVAAVTYLLFGVTPGPGLALSLVLLFAIWMGWRWLCRKYPRGVEPAVLCPAATSSRSQRKLMA